MLSAGLGCGSGSCLGIAARLAAGVAPAPPAGTDPERFIAAVLVVLRDREFARMRARQEASAARRSAASAPPFDL